MMTVGLSLLSHPCFLSQTWFYDINKLTRVITVDNNVLLYFFNEWLSILLFLPEHLQGCPGFFADLGQEQADGAVKYIGKER